MDSKFDEYKFFLEFKKQQKIISLTYCYVKRKKALIIENDKKDTSAVQQKYLRQRRSYRVEPAQVVLMNI
jgi:hypothetical protein